MNRKIKHVDFGIPDARSFYHLIVAPNVSAFEQSPTIQFAVNAVQALWHIHEWHWYDSHPNETTKGNPNYRAFRDNLLQDCPELSYLRDLSDASKHCGLDSRPVPVKGFASVSGRGGSGGWNMPSGGWGVGEFAYGLGSQQFLVQFDDGSESRWLGDIVKTANNFWRSELAIAESQDG